MTDRPIVAFGRICGWLIGAMALIGVLAFMLTALILLLRQFWGLVFP